MQSFLYKKRLNFNQYSKISVLTPYFWDRLNGYRQAKTPTARIYNGAWEFKAHSEQAYTDASQCRAFYNAHQCNQLRSSLGYHWNRHQSWFPHPNHRWWRQPSSARHQNKVFLVHLSSFRVESNISQFHRRCKPVIQSACDDSEPEILNETHFRAHLSGFTKRKAPNAWTEAHRWALRDGLQWANLIFFHAVISTCRDQTGRMIWVMQWLPMIDAKIKTG